jgi:hypothetical protein
MLDIEYNSVHIKGTTLWIFFNKNFKIRWYEFDGKEHWLKSEK